MSKSNFTDKELKAALAEYRNAILASIPDPEEPEFEPSPRYKASMTRLLRKMERKERLHRYSRRAAAAVLVFFLGFGTFIAADVNVRADFLTWLRSTYENSVIYRYIGVQNNAPLPQCELTWIPDGYELVSSEQGVDSLVMVYEDVKSDVFIFTCDRLAESSFIQIGITEKPASERATVNGLEAELFRFQDGDLYLVWIDNKSEFIYSLNGNALDEFVILHIAESVKITK